MKCPKCNGDTKVQCSRTDEEIVARLRKCKECGHHYYTVESKTKNAHDMFSMLEREYTSELKMKKIRRLLDET